MTSAQWLQEGDEVILAPCEKDSYVDHMATLYRQVSTPVEVGILKEIKRGPLKWTFDVVNRKPITPNKR